MSYRISIKGENKAFAKAIPLLKMIDNYKCASKT
jgi:hypothetical protein